jgi:cysteine-rich repeat protein
VEFFAVKPIFGVWFRARIFSSVIALLVMMVGLASPGCEKTREDTSVLVVVTFDPAVYDLDQFRIAGYRVSDSSIAFNPGELPDSPRSTPYGSGRETALVLLPAELVGQEIAVRVWGLRQGQEVAFGRGTVIPELGVMREVVIDLGDAPDCGDGEVHATEETCDTAIEPGMTGECPQSAVDCDDLDVCTADRLEGAGTCLALCFNDRIDTCIHGDGCCPTGCGPTTDSDCDAICGDGLVGTSETCDTGIPPADPGGCPTSCIPDGNPCTDDSLVGGGSCQAECPFNLITEFYGGDSCCPPGGDATLDSDCQPVCGNGVVEPGERCDISIAAGSPGACPTTCEDFDDCTEDVFFDDGTCDARCVYNVETLFVDGDGCCPVGGNNNIDSDCAVTCGNGAVEVGELCDTGIPAGTPGGCPTDCDDTVPCTSDTLNLAGTCQDYCSYVDITNCVHADSCCPPGCSLTEDNDCTAVCGDGIFEPSEGELCDTDINSPTVGFCPDVADCDDTDICTDDTVLGDGTCQAQCANDPVACDGAGGDGCCSPQCNATNDDDCTAICGNGVVEPSGGELCDTGITGGDPGSCLTTCDDSETCTVDSLLGAGTCAAQCDYVPITGFVDNDQCCPAGGNNVVDNDCPVICGNGAVESGETCDTGITAGDAGSCPVAGDCDDSLDCTADTLISDGSCTADCVNNDILTCDDSDGCCPAGCDLSTDNDCDAVCGDGSVTGSETCDTGIVAGQPGACPVLADCEDSDNCTIDSIIGDGTCQAHCDNDPLGCINGDGCCPTGCTNNTDDDCPSECGNGLVESRGGEVCDTGIPVGSPGACPTLADCDDNDGCTADTLANGGTCQALCDNAAITVCDGITSDGCCPGTCDTQTDIDCGGCGNGVLEVSYGEECDDGDSDNTDGCSNSCTSNNGSGGDTCLVNNDCIGQFDCLNENAYNDLVDGYCVSGASCDPDFPSLGCGPKGTCVPAIGSYSFPVCALRCTAVTDCRWSDGHTCQLIGAGVSACLP